MTAVLSILLWAVVMLMVTTAVVIVLSGLMKKTRTTPKKPVTTPVTTPKPSFYRFWCPRCKQVTRHKYIGHGIGLTDGIYYPAYSCEENNCFNELYVMAGYDYSKPGHPAKAR